MKKVVVLVKSVRNGGMYVFPDFSSAWDFVMSSGSVWGAGDEVMVVEV